MISQLLWSANRALSQQFLLHPFIQGIGDGTLSRSRFAFYVGQDSFFLEAFARAYSIAAAKAPDWRGFCAFHHLAKGVLEELELHQGYAQQWGVDLDQIQPVAATRRYTDFLLATAWGQEVGVTAVAMIPCMRLYTFLGQSLSQAHQLNPTEHDYLDWIETYGSPDFEALTRQLEQLGDRYAFVPQETLQSTYCYALDCEYQFFCAAWESG
jgi:thiaminase/transcriptional activator TenA